ncbi:MAG: TonB-dependent receptor plug domain-containing protein, partial [Alistipes sp.]|nr:TonB-dependent receptor plug domain-containing protein [Alistipes sp.]
MSIDIQTCLVVIGDERGVERGVILVGSTESDRGEGVRKFTRIAQRIACDDVDRTSDGRRTEEGRTASAQHLHALDHRGGNLLQSIDSRQRREDGVGVHQNLGVVAIQTVDAHLGKAAVLAGILYADAGLEDQPLGQIDRGGALGYQPGVRVEGTCQNCGFPQVRINGLDGRYSQILIDSHPLFSALTGVYGLEQIPSNMIERVEVLRGGSSALFGSSAIGGTINIITKEPTRSMAEVGHTITSLGCSGAFDNTSTLNASLVSDSGKAAIAIFGQSRTSSGYDHNGDGFTELLDMNSETLGMRAYFRTSAYSRITAQYHRIKDFRRGGDRLDLPPHEALVCEQADHTIDGGSLSFDWSAPDRSNRLSA